MKYLYAPGCALLSYKPELSEKLKALIEKRYGPAEETLKCCFTAPHAASEIECIITPCATCAVNYKKKNPDVDVKFIISELADLEDFPYPDYGGAEMSIQDTCAARTDKAFTDAVRKLLERMNIRLIEPEKTAQKAKCCGQALYGKADPVKIEKLMKSRADEMPREDVVVYCASCILALATGGKKPRFLLDLLFGEETSGMTTDNDLWHEMLYRYR